MWWSMAGAWASPVVVADQAALDIALANAQDGQTIQIRKGSYNGSFIVSSIDLTVEAYPGEDVVLHVSDVLSSSARADGLFHAQGGAQVTVRSLTIDGDQLYRLGRVSGGATLIFEDVQAVRGFFEGAGAGIRVEADSTLQLIDTTIDGCETDPKGTFYGGAIAVDWDGILIASDSVFSNSTSHDGGAIECRGRCELRDNVFSDNTSSEDGGAVDIRIGAGSIVSGNRFCNNEAGLNGGALLITSNAVVDEISHNVFWGNQAGFPSEIGLGGALWSSRPLVLSNNTFIANDANTDGSIWYTTGTNVAATMVDSIVAYNGSDATTALFRADGTSDQTQRNGLNHENTGAAPLGDVLEEGNMLSGDPRFVAYVAGDCEGSDLRLRCDSPALGQGEYGGVLGAFEAAVIEEQAADGDDSDCDGFELCYKDEDQDGVGTAELVLGPLDCLEAGVSDAQGDCDDTDETVQSPADCQARDAVPADPTPPPGIRVVPDEVPMRGCGCQSSAPLGGGLTMFCLALLGRRRA